MILEDRPFKTQREALACYARIESALSLCSQPEEVNTLRIEFTEELEAIRKHDLLRTHLGAVPLGELIDELFNERTNQLKEKDHANY